MRALIIAELRAAWTSWFAVLIAFVATGFAIVIALLMVGSVEATVASGTVPPNEVPALQFIPLWNLFLAVIGTLSVIGAVTGLVVQARRGAVARLALAGATPGQVSRILLAQLAIVALAGAVIGFGIAVIAQPAALAMLLGDRGAPDDSGIVRFDPLFAILGLVGFVLVALLAGHRQARVAAGVPPVEALRTAPGVIVRRRNIGRWIGAALLALCVITIGAAVVFLAPELGRDGADTVLQGAVIAMLISGSALSLSAPLTIGLLTRAWTALIPSRSASWVLARAAVIAKGERLARTITPIMLAVGLLIGIGAIAASTQAMLLAIGHPGIGNASVASFIVLIGLILLVSISGGVSVLLMMSRQREAELALAGVVGATTVQQVLITVFEGVIITVTATILGVVMMSVGMTIFIAGLSVLDLPVNFIMPWNALLAVIVLCGIIVVASTTLPVLRSLQRPARQVVAQLAAE